MPQIETNMEVFGAPFAYLMCWTPNGANLFYYERVPDFWPEVRSAASVFLPLLMDWPHLNFSVGGAR